jgi:hypothetical protein
MEARTCARREWSGELWVVGGVDVNAESVAHCRLCIVCTPRLARRSLKAMCDLDEQAEERSAKLEIRCKQFLEDMQQVPSARPLLTKTLPARQRETKREREGGFALSSA